MASENDMSVSVYLGLGSNLGDSLAQMRLAAAEILQRNLVAEPVRKSSLYRTPPWGDVKDQPRFLNAVVSGKTSFNPLELLAGIQALERDLGRRPSEIRWGPRAIDIDILLFGREMLNLPDLIIPHPRLTERAFVLVPLLEIAPDLTDPATGRCLSDALEMLAEDLRAVERLPDAF